MECEPSVKEEVMKVAAGTAFRLSCNSTGAPSSVAPSKKVAVPVGLLAGVEVGSVTITPNVTA